MSPDVLRNVLDRVVAHFRLKRMRLFARTFPITGRTRVLDVGGSPSIWQFLGIQPRVTFLNLPSAIDADRDSADWVAADGRRLPFRDGSFDIVFSNSVIEHVGDSREQRRFAEEVARVGRAYWVQTPNRRFPIELHMMLPLVHYLPKALQRAIVERFTGWQAVVRPTPEQRRFYVHHFLNELNLLDAAALKVLFPGALILSERVFGFAKSLIAVRR